MEKHDVDNSALYKLWKNMMYIIQHFINREKRYIQNSALYKLWKNVMYSIQHFINYGKT